MKHSIYKIKKLVMIGGGNTAVEESEFISKFASKITMIQQLPYLSRQLIRQ